MIYFILEGQEQAKQLSHNVQKLWHIYFRKDSNKLTSLAKLYRSYDLFYFGNVSNKFRYTVRKLLLILIWKDE